MKSKIKIARNLLNNAIEMNVNRKIIHRLSRKIDSYIIAYYKEFGRLEVNAEQEGEQ
ncbi:MAG: Spo0E family sporulation regulatory protein-aspartic acid phosphatase [Clostridiales bacterium]|nr:Spo0E family sporulation regulatory protein-aspartic acid phosphatase [Clostridiales bacterium]